MFVILYQPTGLVKTVHTNNSISIKGEWIVDTEEDGSVSMIEDLETALSRVKDIRQKGGEACLAAIIE